MPVDSSNQSYEEVEVNGAHIRFTYVQSGSGFECGPCIRIRVKNPDGHLKQGPDIPISHLPDCLRVMTRVAMQMTSDSPNGTHDEGTLS